MSDTRCDVCGADGLVRIEDWEWPGAGRLYERDDQSKLVSHDCLAHLRRQVAALREVPDDA